MPLVGEIAVCAAPGCKELFKRKTTNHLYHSRQCKREVERVKERDQLVKEVINNIGIYEEEPSSEITIDYLRKEVQRLGREVDKHKVLNTERNYAIKQAITEGLSQFQLDSIPPPRISFNNANELVAVIGISDIQLSKVTPSYNTEVAEARMYEYIEKCIQSIEIQRNEYNITTAHIWMLGDVIEGGGSIFPGQTFLIDSGFYRQVTIHGPRIFSNCFRRLLEVVDDIEVHCVIGNHGRIGSRAKEDFDAESNGDRMLYRILDHIFATESRIQFIIPDGPWERNWYNVDYIGNYSCLLMHGDQFQGINSLYTVGRKVMAWKEAIPEDWMDVALGHWHQSMKFTFGKTVLRVFPSSESDNTFAQERLASCGAPMQHLMFIDPEQGIVHSETDIVLT